MAEIGRCSRNLHQTYYKIRAFVCVIKNDSYIKKKKIGQFQLQNQKLCENVIFFHFHPFSKKMLTKSTTNILQNQGICVRHKKELCCNNFTYHIKITLKTSNLAI